MVLIHSLEFEGVEYPLGYKVVTADMSSLGLRRNPNILVFPFDEWFRLPEEEVESGPGDWGGIWVARTPSSARVLGRYMHDRYEAPTRLFTAALDRILYSNSYRLKTNGIRLLEEFA